MREWLKLDNEVLLALEVELSAAHQLLDRVEATRPEPLIEEEDRQKAA